MKNVAEELTRAGRHADAAELMEDEVEGNAAGHLELGLLWLEQLGRIDRALHHLRRSWELGHDPRAMEAMRAVYATVGDDDAQVRLYQEEIASGEPPLELTLAFCRLLVRRGDLAEAARCLESCPPDERVHELLAEVEAGLAADADAAERAVALCLELAAAHRKRGDLDGATVFLRRALGVDPTSETVAAELAAVLDAAGRHAELARLYQQRGLLAERARVLLDKLDNREEAKRCLEALGPVGAPQLRALYATSGDWGKLAALVERGLAGRAPAERRADLLELVTIAREHLGDRERAAGYLRRILDADPHDADAARRYAEHFRDRRDWRGLAELQERLAAAALTPAERTARLEELASTCEARLGDVERANGAWQAVAEADPENPRAREALRRLSARAKMWESLIAVLEREAAVEGAGRVDALRRMAAVYRERQVDPRRAIALYEEALALAPGDAATLKALVELYERQGDDPGVIRTLRRQLEATAGAVMSPPQRMERLSMLRRLAVLAEQRLDADASVYACTGMLELAPADRDAMDRLERALERAGDGQALEAALSYRIEVASGPADKARALRRLAHLAAARGDALASLDRWERVLQVAPTDDEALTALARLYDGLARWRELAGILERRCDTAAADDAERLARLETYARVVDEKLQDAGRAAAAWRRVVGHKPRDREALAALARALERTEAWRELAEVLLRRAVILGVDDRPAAAEVALRAAELLEQRVGAPRDAIDALDRLCDEIAPGHRVANERLARLLLDAGDLPRAALVLERVAWLTRDPDERGAVLLRIAALCRDRLADPRRALHAYERALEAVPDDPRAQAECSALYAAVGEWTQHVATLETLSRRQAVPERAATYLAIARAVEDKLGDAPDAFRWRWKAHELAPGEATLGQLRDAATRAGLWHELVEVLENERASRRSDGPRLVALSREIATLLEARLGDPGGAIAVLGEAIAAAPGDESLYVEAERVAAAASGDGNWRALLVVFQAVMAARPPEPRAALHRRRARILEERLGDASAALDEQLAAFALVPAQATHAEIMRLAGLTGRWEDAVRTDGTIYRQETTDEGKVRVLMRAAAIAEDKLADPGRAFRGYLRALPKAPRNEELRAHLWRLAGVARPARSSSAPLIEEAASNRPVDPTIHLDLDEILELERPDATIQLRTRDLLPVRPPPRPPAPRTRVSPWEELAAAYAALPGELLTAADVWERGAKDVGRAIETLMRARAEAPSDPAPREQLYRLAREHDAWDELARMLLRAADRARTAADGTAYLHEAATIRVEHGEAPQAEGLYRRILGILPDDARARAGLEGLYRSGSRWSELAAALEERADPRMSGARPEAEQVALLDELAGIYAERLGNPYEAIAALEKLTALRPGDVGVLARLAAMYEKVGRWAKVVEALGRVAAAAERTPAGRAARRRMGEVYETELELPARALEVYSALLGMWPDDLIALEGLGRVRAQLGRT